MKTTGDAQKLKHAIGVRVRELREAKSLSQDALADLVGSKKPYISNLENGKGNPGVDKLAELEAVLKAPIIMVAK